MPVNRLVSHCPPLDTNSVYCNLLQCTHFSKTSILAKCGEEYLGFVSAYLIPERPDTVFVWQVAIAVAARGQGLGKQILKTLLGCEACREVCYMETTITRSNDASWALFKSLANSLGCEIERSALFDRVEHFMDSHDTEYLMRFGPFNYEK